VQWKRCNILDGTNDVPAKSLEPIGKFTFGCLANLKENQLEKLVRRLISRTITICERQKGGGRLDLKSMYKVSKTLKRKVVI
jgi:hypothetical protein